MAAISAPKVKHQSILKGVARYLCDKLECAWLFDYQKMPDQITVLTDADWATNPENRRSVDCVHIYFGKSLIESSSCTQQVVALSSGESEFYGLLRGAACALQIRELLKEMKLDMTARVLTDSAAARGVVRRSGSGRVKHLEARWLWIQERVRSGDVVIDCVDTSLNTSDIGTKFLTKRRFEELIAMMPLRLGIGLLAVGGVEGKETKNEDEGSSGTNFLVLVMIVVALMTLVAFLVGCLVGKALGTSSAAAAPRHTEDIVTHTIGSVRADVEKTKKSKHEGDLNDFDIKLRAHLTGLTVLELHTLCVREGFPPGRATKECMVLALLQKMNNESKNEIVNASRDPHRRARRYPTTSSRG